MRQVSLCTIAEVPGVLDSFNLVVNLHKSCVRFLILLTSGGHCRTCAVLAGNWFCRQHDHALRQLLWSVTCPRLGANGCPNPPA